MASTRNTRRSDAIWTWTWTRSCIWRIASNMGTVSGWRRTWDRTSLVLYSSTKDGYFLGRKSDLGRCALHWTWDNEERCLLYNAEDEATCQWLPWHDRCIFEDTKWACEGCCQHCWCVLRYNNLREVLMNKFSSHVYSCAGVYGSPDSSLGRDSEVNSTFLHHLSLQLTSMHVKLCACFHECTRSICQTNSTWER